MANVNYATKGFGKSVAESGVVGNGTTDDTAAFQAAIDAMPDFSRLIIPSGFRIRCTDTIEVNERHGLQIVGAGSMGGYGPGNTPAAKVFYNGTNDVPVFSLDHTRDCLFENFIVDSADLLGTGHANVGMRFMATGAFSGVTTFNRFHGMMFYAGSLPRDNWIGLDIGSASGNENNCESFFVSESMFYGNQGVNSTGILVGHSNSLTHIFEKSWFVGHKNAGVRCVNGSMKVGPGNLFDSNVIDIKGYSPNTTVVEFNRTENGKQFYYGVTPTGTVLLQGNFIGSPGASPGVTIQTQGGGDAMMLIGNIWYAAGTPMDPIVGDAGRLISIGNIYDDRNFVNGQLPQMDTFGGGWISMGDKGLKMQWGSGHDRASAPSLNPNFCAHNGDNFGAFTTGGTRTNLMGITDFNAARIGDVSIPLAMKSNLVAPSTLENGDCWIDFTGTTPNRQLRINVRDGGVTYSQNIGAAH
jgi:hypothetical protein